MTTDAHADLAYLKDMAEAGRKTPLLGGRFGIVWGALFTPPPLILYGQLAGWYTLPGWLLIAAFVVPAALGMLGNFWLSRQVENQPGANSFTNKAAGAVWGSAGIGIGTVFIAALIAELTGFGAVGGPLAWGTAMAALFVAYGIAYGATAMIAGFKGQAMFAGLSFLAAAAMIFTLGRAEQLLVFGIALPLVSVLPGLLMELQAPKDTV
jgi:hypothetical protein